MRRALAFVSLGLALAGCGGPKQRIRIDTVPPGASVYRLDGPSPSAPTPVADMRPVTPTADLVPRGEPIGTTPLIYRAEGDAPYRLLITLDEHEPRAYEVAGGIDVDAHLALALEPAGDLALEDLVLGAILDEGPLSRAEAEEALSISDARPAIERLAEKRLIDRVEARPERWDLSPAGLERLAAVRGRDDVMARLIESRRDIWRSAGRKR